MTMRRLGHEHFHALVPIVLSLILFSWFITRGEWQFFDQEGFSAYYDALGDRMLEGRLDVPRTAITPEAFVRDGKAYGYFGFTPALLRIPFNALFNSRWGQWTRLSMTFACLLSLLITYRIFNLLSSRQGGTEDRNQKVWVGIFLLAAGSGSTMVFLASRAFVYHEAILWGSTLTLLSVYYLLRYQTERSLLMLALAGTTAFLAFFARPTSGAGAVLAIIGSTTLLTFNIGRRNTRIPVADNLAEMKSPPVHLLVAGGFVALTLCCYFATNYIKFHSWSGVPLKYYSQYRQMPDRMLVTGGKEFHLLNFRTGVAAYLGQFEVNFGRHFPWLFMRHAAVYPEARIDVNDYSSAIPASMPALFAMSCIGVWALIRGKSDPVRRFRLPVLAVGLSGGLIFFTVWIYERYLHDLYPLLVLSGIIGLNWVTGLRRPRFRSVALLVFAVLTLASVAINTSFALEYQRDLVWGVPEQNRDEFVRWRTWVDNWVRSFQPIHHGG